MLTRLFSIAANTFVETIRQPIFGVVIMATIVLQVFNVALAAFTFEDDNKLLIDIGLSTLLLSGLFLAAFSATGILDQEIRRKTVITVISKPVNRPIFILGKYLGLSSALAVAFYIGFIVFLFAVRHRVLETTRTPFDGPVLVFGGAALLIAVFVAAGRNFLHNSDFMATAVGLAVPLLTIALLVTLFFDQKWELQDVWAEQLRGKQLIRAGIPVFLAVEMIAAVALAASTRLGQVATLLVSTVVLMVGLIADYLFGEYGGNAFLSKAIYHITPNFSVLSLADPITTGVNVHITYVLMTVGYAACIIGAALLVAIALFQRREVG